MLADSSFVGFIPVTNLASAKEFFVNTLGLRFVHEDDFALVVDANGTALRLTPVAGLHPQPFTVAGWSSNDVAPTVGRLSDAGVAFLRFDGLDQDELGIWHAPGGDLVAWFSDPDGNILSISGHEALRDG
jgi:catechol 2,3-dioxygenase-like lactoylglutathione lyase family enzyme